MKPAYADKVRMIVLKRTRSGTEAYPREEVDLVGSTGNIYTVRPCCRYRFAILES
jgi:hypothetical protein